MVQEVGRLTKDVLSLLFKGYNSTNCHDEEVNSSCNLCIVVLGLCLEASSACAINGVWSPSLSEPITT